MMKEGYVRKGGEEVNEQKRAVYIMLTDTGSWLNRMIKRYTNAPYNHASIGLDENLDGLYSFGRRKPKNPFYGGFVKEDVVEGTYRYFPNTTCVIYRMQVNQKEYKKIKQVIRKFEKLQTRYTYNFLGLLAVTINKPIKRRKAYFCSQFIAEVFEQAGLKLFAKDNALVQPEDFRSLPNTEVVYEGKLYDYQKVVDKIGTEWSPGELPDYRFFLKPIRKTIRFVNPMFYYHYAMDKATPKEK